jgi:hypothetical protein
VDLLVRLYDLPPQAPARGRLKEAGVNGRRIEAYEASLLARFIEANFGEQWADEEGCCFAFRPPACFVATRAGKIIGFAGYAYAIVGGADGAEGFYTRCVPVMPIPESTPGIYVDWLVREDKGAVPG